MTYLENLLTKKNDYLADKEVSLYCIRNMIDEYGLDKAFDVLSKHNPNDLIRADKSLDKFDFYDITDDQKRLDGVLEFLESENSEFEKVTQSFRFTTLKDVNRLLPLPDRSHNRTQIINTIERLIALYGIDASKEEATANELFSFLSMQKDSGISYIPNVTMQEVVDHLLSIDMDKHRVYNIDKGFDDWKVALEASTLDYRKKSFLLSAGLTSMDALSLELPTKIIGDWNYNPGAEYSEWNLKEYLKGDVDKFNEFMKVFNTDDAAVNKISIFKGDIGAYMKFMALDERPSHEALRYVADNFDFKDFDKIVTFAKHVETPNKNIYSFRINPEAGYPKSLVTFHLAKDKYEELNANYKQITGTDADLTGIDAEAALEHPSALAFVKEFYLYKKEEKEDMKIVSDVLSYDEWKNMKLESHHRKSYIPDWIKKGYSKERILELGQLENLYFIEQICGKDGPPIDVIRMLQDQPITDKHALLGFSKIYDLFGPDKIPYNMIPAFEANKILSRSLRDFVDIQGIGRYKDDKGFNGVQFIRDYKVFYNINNNPHK